MDGGTAPLPGYCELKGVLFQLDPGRPIRPPYLGQPLDDGGGAGTAAAGRQPSRRRLQIANKLSSTRLASP